MAGIGTHDQLLQTARSAEIYDSQTKEAEQARATFEQTARPEHCGKAVRPAQKGQRIR